MKEKADFAQEKQSAIDDNQAKLDAAADATKELKTKRDAALARSEQGAAEVWTRRNASS